MRRYLSKISQSFNGYEHYVCDDMYQLLGRAFSEMLIEVMRLNIYVSIFIFIDLFILHAVWAYPRAYILYTLVRVKTTAIVKFPLHEYRNFTALQCDQKSLVGRKLSNYYDI